MKAYHDTLEIIKSVLRTDKFVKTISVGNIYDVDLKKQTIFPLAHLMVENAQYTGTTWIFRVAIIFMDLSSKDREDYIFNTQLSVASNLLDKLKRGGLKLQLVGEASLDPFVDRFDSAVAGWTCTLSVEIENDMLML